MFKLYLMRTLDAWALDHACTKMKLWNAQWSW